MAPEPPSWTTDLDARDANGERFEKQPLRVVMGKTEITDNYRIRGMNPPEGVEADPQNFLQVFTHDRVNCSMSCTPAGCGTS